MMLVLAAGIVVTVLAATGIGAVSISPGQIAAILGGKIGLSLPWSYEMQQAQVLLSIRLPRVLLGLFVGASLGISGAAMQGLFRNPLADPGLIGISSGAAFAVVATIVAGQGLLAEMGGLLATYGLSLAAFAGAAVTTFIVYRISSVNGRVSVSTMLLAGIAVNALAAAGTGLFTYIADDAQLRTITFWSLGSLGGATWESLAGLLPFVLIPLISIPLTGQTLNALLLGKAEAGHLGMNVDRANVIVITMTTLCVGASVAVAGVIGFAGLVTPHLLRLIIGPDHRMLLPGSALLGGILLITADLAARTIAAPAELPIGIITAAIGAPFFLWLLMNKRGGAASWSAAS